jgi:hypothetical protein
VTGNNARPACSNRDKKSVRRFWGLGAGGPTPTTVALLSQESHSNHVP